MILSVSRRTDIPCCYPEWFLNRVRAGYALVRNPLNPAQVSRISLAPDVVDCIVFWTKDPAPLLPYLPELDRLGYRYYFQFTLTPYGHDIEPGLRDKGALEDTFLALSSAIGREKVVWRYDPVLLTETCSAAWHREQFSRMCDKLSPFTESVTLSFLDLYPRVKRLGLVPPTPQEAAELAAYFGAAARNHGLTPQACAEPYDLTPYGIRPAACIDPALIGRICGGTLLAGPGRGQRAHCGCCESIDIGAYDTCKNGCLYCYADHGRRVPPYGDPGWELLTGPLLPGDVVHERTCSPQLSYQTTIY